MKKNQLKGIKLGRTVGVEVEGYTGMYRTLVNNGVRHSNAKYDGSLSQTSTSRGIEIVTKPINELDLLDEVFEDIVKYQWNVGRGTAGTHVHVDAKDYKLYDRLKMAIFMNLIEKAMFLLVKKSRWSRNYYGRNQYCRPIDSGWKELLNKLKNDYSEFDLENYKNIGDLQYAIIEKTRRAGNYGNRLSTPNTTRYQFVNIWQSSHPTIEFRIFHSIRSSKDAKLFSLIGYHIVEIVKNSTLEHLEYIADEIMNKSTSAEDMIEKFSQAVGLDFVPKIYNDDLKARINRDKEVARRIIAVS